jgi:hypothetical protein
MTEIDTLPCPGCHTPLPPEATGCQICMRPRTRQEIMRGYAKLREDKARKRRRPFQILAALLALGGGGWLLTTHGARLKAAASSAGGAVVRWADDLRNPSHYAMRSTPKPEPKPEPPAAPGDPVAPERAMRSQLFPEDVAPAQPTPPADAPAKPAPRPSGPRPLAKNAWRVSGAVYDLATLEPVPGAEVTFLRDEKEPQATRTDERGAYEIDLVKGSGWTVSVISPDRRRGQILDIDPSYRVRDADERRAALNNVTDGDLIPAPVGWKASSSKVRLDLFAVPYRWTGPSSP